MIIWGRGNRGLLNIFRWRGRGTGPAGPPFDVDICTTTILELLPPTHSFLELLPPTHSLFELTGTHAIGETGPNTIGETGLNTIGECPP